MLRGRRRSAAIPPNEWFTGTRGQHVATSKEMWPFCENPVCPDRVCEPVILWPSPAFSATANGSSCNSNCNCNSSSSSSSSCSCSCSCSCSSSSSSNHINSNSNNSNNSNNSESSNSVACARPAQPPIAGAARKSRRPSYGDLNTTLQTIISPTSH